MRFQPTRLNNRVVSFAIPSKSFAEADDLIAFPTKSIAFPFKSFAIPTVFKTALFQGGFVSENAGFEIW